MSIAVFDLDGTIADITHRLHWIKQTPKDWDAFFGACMYDEPIPGVIEWMRYMSRTHIVVILSGRSERVEHETRKWLAVHNVKYDYLFMRPEGNKQDDTEIKANLMAAYVKPLGEVDFIVEDRPSMIKMWRRNGFIVYPVTGDSWD